MQNIHEKHPQHCGLGKSLVVPSSNNKSCRILVLQSEKKTSANAQLFLAVMIDNEESVYCTKLLHSSDLIHSPEVYLCTLGRCIEVQEIFNPYSSL